MISKDKQYRTRDGRPVRIYATDGRGVSTVHGAILQPGDGYGVTSGNFGMEWGLTCWNEDGRHCCSNYDLIEVKPRIKRTVWLNVYEREDDVYGYISKERADNSAAPDRILCVKFEIDAERGEGL